MNLQHPTDTRQTWRDLLPSLDPRVADSLIDDAEHGVSDRALLAMARQAIDVGAFGAECDRVHAEAAPDAPRGVDRSEWWQPDRTHPEAYREITLSDNEIGGTAWHVRTIVEVSVTGKVSDPTVEIWAKDSRDDTLTVAQAVDMAAALAAAARCEERAA